MTASDSAWCLVESDPGAFTELLRGIGVKGVQVEEIYSLDGNQFKDLRPLYGLIFLFKWREGDYYQRDTLPSDDARVYFASQVIDNACATQAVLSIVLNRNDIEIGDDLQNFKNFTKDFPATMKGLTIGNSDLLRKVHNSFARPHLDALMETPLRQIAASNGNSKAGSNSDVYHFVSFVPIDGVLYELDGLSKGPYKIGPCTEENWVEVARPAIQSRIKSYSSSEIRFNLMAVIKERKVVYLEALQKQDLAYSAMNDALNCLNASQPLSVDVNWEELGLRPPANVREATEALQKTEEARVKLRKQIADEDEKMEKQRLDNIHRKHNYFPFIEEMLKILASKGELVPLLKQAQAQE